MSRVALYDNTRPHAGAHAIQTLQHQLRFEALEHPSYGPDLVSSVIYVDLSNVL
jgi:hypothetical protein